MTNELTISSVKNILTEVGFPQKNITDITAICILALYDTKPRKKLIKDYTYLAQGARIRDILDFARTDLGRGYAENTRETVRKHSLKYLVDSGMVIQNADDPNRVTNSGLNNYILSDSFKKLLDAYLLDKDSFEELKGEFVDNVTIERRNNINKLKKKPIIISLASSKEELVLSPGDHNIIEKFIVEDIFPKISPNSQFVYIGDTRLKNLYINHDICQAIGLKIDVHTKIPDVIGYDDTTKTILLFEAVASSGPIDELRKKELLEIFHHWPHNIIFGTTFLTQKLFQSFSTSIASGTTAYIIESRKQITYQDYE
ncbi:BsuBI/PstI family type II restriction endonuclease [Bacillus safensis]|uniref:BsuBI/PstI family type II restriction endonuclease n=1 Tax=Bacillus safensis TaxID=561879 RepID=UPI00245360D6|nr:BsuBI/PstI family type II restriction endonuclease [Bacillus safensis]MDH3094449.1 BsuBI/PstI family type II restriction endonuclease [Bacillus safensis]